MVSPREPGTERARPADTTPATPRRLDRRGLIGIAGLGAVAATAAASGGVQYALDRSAGGGGVGGTPPRMTVLRNERRALAPGSWFYTDIGPEHPALILAGPEGAPQWLQTGEGSYCDFRLQTYRGEPVLAFWETPDTEPEPYGPGRCVVLGLDRREVASFGEIDGAYPDEHELLLTPQGTALTTSYVRTTADLTSIGGASRAVVVDSMAQEVDLRTGRLLHRWSALDHVDLTESFAGFPGNPADPYDFFHINAIEPCPDGTWLVSARYTWAVYRIDPDSGRVLWRLGGKRSDFTMPWAARFAYQHDIRREPSGRLRMFDNGTEGIAYVQQDSRILWLDLDERRRTATVARELRHPDRISGHAMGNAQVMDNGNVVVGWGTANRISEFTAGGELVFDAALPGTTYRAYKAVLPA